MEDYAQLILYFSILKDEGVNIIYIDYSGSGDEGCINDVSYYKEFDINDFQKNLSIDFNIDEKLENLFKIYCSETILDDIEDWYNNEGGYGHIIFNVNDQSYTIENNIYRQEVDTFNHNGILKIEL